MNIHIKSAKKFWKNNKKNLIKFGLPILFGIVMFLSGYLVSNILKSFIFPTNIVWPAEKAIKIPISLRNTLEKLDDCKGYRGIDTPRGVGLWGVYQVEDNSFAKISYGCSTSLSNYIVAVKSNNKWVLLQPVEYFSDTSQGIPNCNIVTKYKIPVALESFCSNDKGEIVKNPTPL